jgi:hypothetical protein
MWHYIYKKKKKKIKKKLKIIKKIKKKKLKERKRKKEEGWLILGRSGGHPMAEKSRLTWLTFHLCNQFSASILSSTI